MIRIITPGGIIESYNYEGDNVAKSVRSISDYLDEANISFQYPVENVLGKDSSAITATDRTHLVERIKASNANKI